jgi:ribose transport system permease protein
MDRDQGQDQGGIRPSDRATPRLTATLLRLSGQYGMFGVLLLLALLFSILTLREQQATGSRAARALLSALGPTLDPGIPILIVAREGEEDARFTVAVGRELGQRHCERVAKVLGDPVAIRHALLTILEGEAVSHEASSAGAEEHAVESGKIPAESKNSSAQSPGAPLVLTLEACAPVVQGVLAGIPGSSAVRVCTPPSYRWPTFLLANNLRNVANQIAVIAILAIGMTLVILTGGIDLSVGSLIALAAVVSAWLIGKLGGETASAGALAAGRLGAILLCAGVGAFSGLMITRFQIPPFIATLAMMQVSSGLAYIISQGRPIYRLPESSVILGRGADPILGVPYAVWLMLVLYAGAHLIMARTTLGRYIYAVGGNAEAARLAGVRVPAVLFLVYSVCGALAGLGGVVMASQLKSGAPTYGLMYELYVIAAVVVGGTSLSGGEGRILGTLIGAFIIAVIQNGMNLVNVESYTQKVVLGLVILSAVLLDRLKQRRWRSRRGPPTEKEVIQ